jgi:hypothetical protein
VIKVRFSQLDIVVPNDADPEKVSKMVLNLLVVLAREQGWDVYLNGKRRGP